MYPELEEHKAAILNLPDNALHTVIIRGDIGGGKTHFAKSVLKELYDNCNPQDVIDTYGLVPNTNLLFINLNHLYVDKDYYTRKPLCYLASSRFTYKILGSILMGAVIETNDYFTEHDTYKKIVSRIKSRFLPFKSKFHVIIVDNDRNDPSSFDWMENVYHVPYLNR